MIGGQLPELWFYLGAVGAGHGATGVEPAAAGRIGRTRNVAFEDDPVAVQVWIRHGNSRNERLGVRMLGMLGNDLGVADLDQLAEVHDTDPIRDMRHDGQVVGDEEIGQLEIVLELTQQVEHLGLNRHIERGDRLVADDEIRVERQRARDTNALALTARELVRVAVGEVAIESDNAQ